MYCIELEIREHIAISDVVAHDNDDGVGVGFFLMDDCNRSDDDDAAGAFVHKVQTESVCLHWIEVLRM